MADPTPMAECGCVYHAEEGTPCRHDVALASDAKILVCFKGTPPSSASKASVLGVLIMNQIEHGEATRKGDLTYVDCDTGEEVDFRTAWEKCSGCKRGEGGDFPVNETNAFWPRLN